jgi:membrane protein
VAELTHSETNRGPAIAAGGPQETAGPLSISKRNSLCTDGKALISYLLNVEVHTFAFSVAANLILSFIPFVVLLYTLSLSVFHSREMVNVVDDMVNYFLPSVTREPNWLAKNIEAAAAISSRHGVQAFSLVMIFVACTGIFLPLEVALNRAWGVTRNRNYLLNQLVAFGLVPVMVVLAMISIFLNEYAQQMLTVIFLHHTHNVVFRGLSYLWLAATTGVAAILFFFFIYWLLPHCKVPWWPVFRAAVVAGIVWLASRAVFVAVLPHMDLQLFYGPFYVSVGLLLWAYVSGLILFAGAQYSVARCGTAEKVRSEANQPRRQPKDKAS